LFLHSEVFDYSSVFNFSPYYDSVFLPRYLCVFAGQAVGGVKPPADATHDNNAINDVDYNGSYPNSSSSSAASSPAAAFVVGDVRVRGNADVVVAATSVRR